MARAYLVVPKGTIVLGAYTRDQLADEHMRCATGTEVVAVELLERTLVNTREDLIVDEWEDEDTPRVVDVPITGHSIAGEIDTSRRR